MPGEQILLDPTGEATGTQFDITDTTAGYSLLEHDYPSPEDEVQWASSADTEGERRASTRPKNFAITVTVRCLQPAAGTPSIGTLVKQLQQKIGKFKNEGGTVRRVLPSGDAITFDVEAAAIKVPSDKRWIVRQVADVTLTLICRPYGRGAQQTLTLSASTATAKAPLVFTATGVKGDVPALGSLMLSNVTNAKSFAIWGLQSRYYDSDPGAALFMEAEDGTAGAATLNAGSAGASGGGANKVLRHADVGTASTGTTSYFAKGPGTNPLRHIGTYRVLARVQALSANTGIVSVRLGSTVSAGGQVLNDWVPIQTSSGVAIKGSWVLIDLGQVALPKARAGTQSWTAELVAKSTVATDDLDYDWLMLVPVDEGSGQVTDTGNGIQVGGVIEVADDAVQNRTAAGGFWYDPIYEGDLLRIPPAGAEARTLRVIALIAGQSGGNLTDTLVDAANLDAFTATLTYRPRYLVVPEP